MKKFINKLPYWLKSGFVIGIIGALIIGILPDEFTNLAFVPWYLSWIVIPIFLVYATVCIVFRIAFISNSNDVTHLFILKVIGFFSAFVIFFLIGSLTGFVVGLIKSKKQKLNV